MNYSEAKKLLLLHGSGLVDQDGTVEVASDGFTGSLRPYGGLIERNFHTVLESIYVVGQSIQTEDYIEREVICTLWFICTMTRRWALAPNGMLVRNKLITCDDSEQLQIWLELIEATTQAFLNGKTPYAALSSYASYVSKFGAGENIQYFLPFFNDYLASSDFDPTEVARALGTLGDIGIPALPALRIAADREFSHVHDDEAQTALEAAITAIELTQIE